MPQGLIIFQRQKLGRLVCFLSILDLFRRLLSPNIQKYCPYHLNLSSQKHHKDENNICKRSTIMVNQFFMQFFVTSSIFSSKIYSLKMKSQPGSDVVSLNQKLHVDCESLIDFELAPHESRKRDTFSQSCGNRPFPLFLSFMYKSSINIKFIGL